jgi:hypothetical protein
MRLFPITWAVEIQTASESTGLYPTHYEYDFCRSKQVLEVLCVVRNICRPSTDVVEWKENQNAGAYQGETGRNWY